MMSLVSNLPSVTTNPSELESLIRRIVRQELRSLLSSSRGSLLADLNQEGPEDPLGDEELLGEALVVLEQYGNAPDEWMSWEDFEFQLAAAEAAGELPD